MGISGSESDCPAFQHGQETFSTVHDVELLWLIDAGYSRSDSQPPQAVAAPDRTTLDAAFSRVATQLEIRFLVS